LTARLVRRVVTGVCVAGVAGMIASSVRDDTGAALTFGLVTATAVLCLMVATAVSGGPADVEEHAARIEQRVQRLVEEGVAEEELRALVRDSVRLGRSGR
jgi:hypothetical protein